MSEAPIRRKRRRVYDTDEFLKACGRMLRAGGRRVGSGDTVDLAALVALREEMERVEVEAVDMMRATHGYSWTEIGRDLGMTRQAAQQKYAPKIAAMHKARAGGALVSRQAS